VSFWGRRDAIDEILPGEIVTCRNLLKKMEPVVGFEPTTDGLQNSVACGILTQ